MRKDANRTPLTPAQSALVAENADLVVTIAARERLRRGFSRTVTRDELRSHAALGLCVAARVYDPSRGSRFRAWACFRVPFEIREAMRLKESQIPRLLEYEPIQGRDHAAPDGLVPAVERAIETLPPREREAVYRRHFYDETLEQIGDALGVTEGGAEWLIRSAHRRLAPLLRAFVAADSMQARAV